NGVPREDHFDITVASEIMAILCLCKSLEDFKERVNKIVVAYTYDKTPVTVQDLGCAGAVTMIMKDAIKPNLVQTLEHNPVLIHGGPFANIAHGCNSAIATKLALSISDYVVTEAGFGADLGAEKFFDIKCRATDITPNVVVIVATIRALKMHGGVKKEDLSIENIDALKLGISNLEKHIENIQKFNLPFVIAINKFNTDTNSEVDVLTKWAKLNNHDISLSEVFTKGSEGGLDLAKKVILKAELETSMFKYLYDVNDSIENKIKSICTNIYGAKNVEISTSAMNQIKLCEKNGWEKLPICIAKNPYSFSDNPKLLGRPKDFTISIKEIKASVGAGFLVVITADVMTMPGLPKVPAANKMDVIDGKIIGLF
ncbi:MAG: formate--tetrahydrofolate ligase, partial [Anaeroplasmataceae bacterium]